MTPSRIVVALIFCVLGVLASRDVRAQTPAPLQEWQYSSGIPLERLFEPELPRWEVETGIGAEVRPLYDGATAYRVVIGPIFNVQFEDIAFASTGEGIGVNLLRGDKYRAGVAIGYDFGRKVGDDLDHLRGFTDIRRAPVFKVFGSYVFSKDFPAVVRVDVRQSFARGLDGMVGDLSIYMPLPGSSTRFFWFAGPSVTIGGSKYMQKRFGVTADQAASTGYPEFDARAGAQAAGFGLSADIILTEHWIIDLDGAYDWLFGGARDSPITQRTNQRSAAFSIVYKW